MSSSRRSAQRKEQRDIDNEFKKRVVELDEMLSKSELYWYDHPYGGEFDRCIACMLENDLPYISVSMDDKLITIVNRGRVAALTADAERPTGPRGDNEGMSDCGE